MNIKKLNKLVGIFSLLGFSAGSASGAIITATDVAVTPAAGIQTELFLAVEDLLLAGTNQSWGSVLLRIDGTLGSPGQGDNYSISVFEEDVATNDVVFTTSITGSALSLNNGWWEYSANLVFDPAIYQDESENFLALRAIADISLDLGLGGFTDDVSLSTNPLLQAAVVPVPAAAWLFGSGLIGIAGVARRKQRENRLINNPSQAD